MSIAEEQQSASIPARQEDAFEFHEELCSPAGGEEIALPAWRVLITDDDVEVHRATTFALRGLEVDGRPLELLHAESAEEAIRILRTQTNIAVAMLDVVMETPDAGLRLVDSIRGDLGLHSIRIILRTGQPGYAPELEVIRRYDINDYRTKSELNQTRLITTLTSAIRAYEQLELVRAANHGMEAVARFSNDVFRLRSSSEFARTLLQGVNEILGRGMDAVVCLEQAPRDVAVRDHGLYIEAGSGRFAPMQGCQAEKALDQEILRAIRRCSAARTCVFEPSRVSIWLGNDTRDAVAVLEVQHGLHEVQRRLLEMFSASLTVGFENVDLIERLNFFAFFDPLTHLPNRSRFLTEVDQDLYARQGGSRCLAIADVVRFSDVNDALGHRCGDSLLVAVARRLRGALGAAVTISRISGDSFGLYGSENALDPQHVRKAFEQPFFVHGHALAVQMRVGLVRVSQCKGNAMELLRSASLALQQARQASGAACCEFSVMMSEDVQTRVSLLHSLRAAIDFKRGLSLHYQPWVNAATGDVLGVEALLRWRNDFGEMVPPLRFISLAERTGMINELGMWVLDQALDRLAAWHRQGHRKLMLAVNVSPVQLRSEDFVYKLKQALTYADVLPGQLIIDLTEAVGLEDQVMLGERLQEIRRLGVRLAIDDFGTGHSSLRQMISLLADMVKIDPCYVERVHADERDRAVAASLLGLAGRNERLVMAEGVECAEQVSVLLELGCEVMQGYHFARPMPADQFDGWLRTWRAEVPAG